MNDAMKLPWIKDYMEDYDAKRYKDDMKYLKSLYMPMSMEILSYAAEECDKLEYEGSFMFDECPDKQALKDLVQRVKKKAAYLENMYRPVMEEDEHIKNTGHCVSCRGMESWLDNLVWVIVCEEICYRRRRYFKIKKR